MKARRAAHRVGHLSGGWRWRWCFPWRSVRRTRIYGAGETANGQSSAPEHIKLAAPPYFTSAPFYLAADLGFFAAEGLDVEFVNIAFSKGALPALAQEQVDVVGTSLNAGVVNLIGRGAKVRIVAARTYEAVDGCPGAAVLVRKGLLDEGRLASGASMRGLRFSIDRAGVTACTSACCSIASA